MSVILVVVLVVLGVLLLLALLGGAAASRRNRAQHASLRTDLAAVDRQLAAAARAEFSAQRPGAQISELELVQIRDEPGTDQDLAVFRIHADGRGNRLTLGRRDGAWYAAALEDER
jgi:Flp pilus assembly protein TadB